MKSMLFNIVLALRALRNNMLRSVITILVIGLGIMALVGILTGIEVMKAAISSSFSSMGANTFQLTSDIIKKKSRKGGISVSFSEGKYISWAEAQLFKERYTFPSTVSISVNPSSVATLKHAEKKTNPNISVTGTDEHYLTVNDVKLAAGRNLTPIEVNSGAYVCILGQAVATKLFNGKLNNAINSVVSVGDVKCRVVGVMESKGASMFMNSDNSVLIPINAARQLYGGENAYYISVAVPEVGMKQFAAEEAEGIFRVIRKVPLGAENNFSVSQNDEIVKLVIENTGYVQAAAIVICIITLLNSIIGLMNIMLESVTERTREIGVNKALGARESFIRNQFLTESVLISVIGGCVGVVAGLLAGNMLTFVFHIGFVVPWFWIGVGVGLCIIVGVVSGIYPALKASRLDPIVALRYE
ncbi:MAG: FtsX-like permease family protein [Chitinophagia bacterium]|nr:FtsX-like permease family protein [Chitinophagia bacterium]